MLLYYAVANCRYANQMQNIPLKYLMTETRVNVFLGKRITCDPKIVPSGTLGGNLLQTTQVKVMAAVLLLSTAPVRIK